MRPCRLLVLILILTCLASPHVAAQPSPSPVLSAQRNAMDDVAFLVGNWEGTGWMQIGDHRTTFRSSEKVEAKLAGLALVVEGKHEADVPGRVEPIVVHHALAMLTYDPEEEVYRFNTQIHRGGTGRYEGYVEDGAFIWGMPQGEAMIRYTTRLDDAERWHETGERSTDGKNWSQFFELTLNRVD